MPTKLKSNLLKTRKSNTIINNSVIYLINILKQEVNMATTDIQAHKRQMVCESSLPVFPLQKLPRVVTEKILSLLPTIEIGHCNSVNRQFRMYGTAVVEARISKPLEGQIKCRAILTQSQLEKYGAWASTKPRETRFIARCEDIEAQTFVLKKCQALRELALGEEYNKKLYYDRQTRVVPLALSALEHCPRLTALSFNAFVPITGDDLERMLPHCGHLQKLAFHFKGENFKGEKSALPAVRMVGCCSALTSLSITDEYHKLEDRDMQTLATGLSRLVSVTIQDAHRVTCAGMVPLIERNLVALELRSIPEFKVAGFQALSRHASRLERLSLQSIPFPGKELFHALFSACSVLRDLHLDNVKSREGEELELPPLPHLTTIKINNIWSWVTDRAMQQLAETSRNLRCVDLDGCIQISDRSVQAFASHCPNLESLSVCKRANNIHRITHISIQALCTCVNLRYFSFYLPKELGCLQQVRKFMVLRPRLDNFFSGARKLLAAVPDADIFFSELGLHTLLNPEYDPFFSALGKLVATHPKIDIFCNKEGYQGDKESLVIKGAVV